MQNVWPAAIILFWALAASPSAPRAQDARDGRQIGPPFDHLLGTFGTWDAYTYTSPEGKVCALSSKPAEQDRKNDTQNFFVITRRPAGTPGAPGYFEAAWRAGVRLPAGLYPDMRIGRRRFRMHTGYDPAARIGDAVHWAWPENPKDTPRLVNAMRRGLNMSIRIKPAPEGAQIENIYSLKGVSAALKKIADVCS